MFIQKLRQILHDRSGSVILYGALLMPVIVGFSGLALDVGSWYKTQQGAQIAADAAATAGAWEVANGSAASAQSAGLTDSAKNGFTNGTNGVTVIINNPPTSGTYAGNANAVEAIVSQQATSLLSAVVFQKNFQITSRAVALETNTPATGGGTACMLALNKTMSGAFLMNGNLKANFQNCIIASNSTSNSAVTINGNVKVTAGSIYTAGNIYQNGNTTLQLNSPASTGAKAITDPYSSTTIPSYGDCDQTNYSPNSASTLNPGVYCGGISLTKNATLNPGTYYLKNGGFTANSQSIITCNCSNPGDGVTIVLTGSSPGGVTINGGAQINLQAPTNTNDHFKGFLFFQDPNASSGNAITFNGSSTISMTGTLYFPKGAFTWNGDSSTPPSCTQVVADSIKLNGNTTVTDSTCGTQGAGQISTAPQVVNVSVVE